MTSERIFAYKGYYIAVYVQEVQPGTYLGVGAICTALPRDARSAKPIEGVVSRGSYGDPGKALKAAEHQARQVVDGLQPNWDPFTRPGTL
jgi:hypothetical protein